MSAVLPKTMTAAEYLERERTAEFKSEYRDGEVVALAGSTRRHSTIVLNIAARLEFQLRDTPCLVYATDLRTATPPDRRYVYPDVVVTCGSDERFEDDLEDTLLTPLLVIEILSPSTEAYDRGEKFESYRAVPTLLEYVLVSQKRPQIERYVRQEDGGWRYDAVIGLDATLRLTSVPALLELSGVYRKTRLVAPATT